ncbi:MAG TPA: type 2 lanthipeptide synthetase LanM family protein, partial [Blastocatellia bacterium]|nr:type 2 lanthipeptide synthetase LanM family protein [Blastocatellia bacterium]
IGGVDAGETALGLAAKTMGHSVLRIGLLPQKTWGNAEAQGVELSGIGGAPGQITPFKVPVFEDEGTDCMRIVRKQVPISGKNNRPSLDGADINPQDYAEDIVQGFTSVYRTIVDHQGELLSADGPLMSFSEDEVRVVLRPTRTYGVLLNESYHPDALRDALDRDRLFDKLWVGVASRPFLARVVKAERADLLRGDIPIFSSRPGSRNLWTSRNDAISEVFDEPSLEVVNNRIRGLNEDDLSRQVWFIRASLTTLVMGTGRETWKRYKPAVPSGIVTRERLLEASCAVGDRLGVLALRNNDLVSWIGVTMVDERDWSLLPLGGDLYSGTLGVVLYLAYLGEVTGRERYTELAKVAFANLESGMDAALAKPKLTGGVGAFSGWGAMVYALAHLHSLWQERRLLDEADRFVEALAGIVGEDRSFDLIGGTAGCLAALIALYRHAGSENSLHLAVRCGDHLIANARKMTQGIGWLTLEKEAEVPLTGFSHGCAGIALMLLELSALTGMGRFREAAIEAMAYERSVFCPEIGNWPDFRRFGNEDGEKIKSMFAWCHGAPGIGLGRLRSLTHVDDPVIREEISIALRATVEQGFGHNHSLCHGDLGNLETLLAASEMLEDSEWQERLGRLTAVILDSINANGWICGVPFGVETPGLMTGLAGIGYGLLRLAEPARVPSVLTLAPPISSGIRRHNGSHEIPDIPARRHC